MYMDEYLDTENNKKMFFLRISGLVLHTVITLKSQHNCNKSCKNKTVLLHHDTNTYTAPEAVQ